MLSNHFKQKEYKQDTGFLKLLFKKEKNVFVSDQYNIRKK